MIRVIHVRTGRDRRLQVADGPLARGPASGACGCHGHCQAARSEAQAESRPVSLSRHSNGAGPVTVSESHWQAIWNPDTLYVLAHTRTYRVHTEYDHAL